MTVRGTLGVAGLLACVALSLTGCGSASAPSPPAGVDGLVIPTPSPHAEDFVSEVDNPWFPLEPGSTWRYDVTDARGTHPLTVTARPGPTVDGVGTTARVATERGRRVTDYYAQDTEGNVWWFGRKGSWAAGTGGAEAGLAMAATPRVGDGYREAYDKGVVEDVAHVESVSGTATVPAGEYDDLVLVEHHSTLDAVTRRSSYARGVGLVEEDVIAADYRTVRLVRVGR